MILKKITADRFLGWEHLVVDLSAFSGVTSVMAEIDGEKTRSNGAGKSSFVHAIIFAMYGEVRGDSLDDLIKDHCAAGFKVVLEIEQDGVDYSITRSKTLATSQKCVVHRLGGKKKEIVSDDPVAFFKLPDYDIFSSSVYSPQNEISGFADEKPASQKTLLQKLFSLEKYQNYERQARDLSLELDSEIKQVSAKADLTLSEFDKRKAELQKIIDQGYPDKIKSLIEKIAVQKTEEDTLKKALSLAGDAGSAREELVKKSAAIAEDIIRQERAAAQFVANIESAEQKIAKSREEIAVSQANASTAKANMDKQQAALAAIVSASSSPDTITGLENSIKITRKAWQASLSAIEVAKAGAVSETARKDNLNRVNGVCPMCSSIVDDEHRAKILAGVSEKLAAYREEMAKQQATAEQLAQTVASLEAELKSAQSQEQRLLKVKAEIAFYASAVDNANRNISSLNDYIKRGEAYVSANTEDASLLAKKLDEADKEKAEIDAKIKLLTADETVSLKEKLNSITATIAADQNAIVAYEKQLAICSKLDEQVKELYKSFEELCDQRDLLTAKQKVYKELAIAFGSSGIPVLILENEMQVLQQYISEYLSRLSGDRLTLQIATTKKAATGKTSETLQLVCSKGDSDRKLSTFSGGERVRVYLAVRLAIAKYLRDIGVDFGFIIIDEVSDLDEDGLTGFVEALKGLSSEFKNILVVSHLDRINESFDSCLLFNKGNSAEY